MKKTETEIEKSNQTGLFQSLVSLPFGMKLALLFVAALLPRIFVLFQPNIITTDGVFYIEMAKAFSEGRYTGVPRDYFTLYPMMIYFVQRILGDWELSGQLISITLGALTVVPVFLLGRSLYSEKVGWFSAIFYITLPNFVQFDSQVLRDPTYWFFVAFSLWFVWEGLLRKRLIFFGLASISAGLGAITRVDGFVLWGALALLTLFRGFRAISLKRGLLSLMLFILVFPLFLSPLLFFVKKQSTEIAFREMISISVSVMKGTRLNPVDPRKAMSEKTYESLPMISKDALKLASRHRAWIGIMEVIYKFVKSANFLVFFILIGFWRRKREGFRFSDGYLLFVFAAFFLVDVFYTQQIYYFSTRHGLTLVLPVLHFAGPGVIFASEALSRIKKRIFPNGEFVKRYAPHLLTLILVIIFAVQGVSSKTNKIVFKEVGRWLKEEGYKGSVMMAPKGFVRLVFYGDGKFVKMPGSWEEAIRRIHQDKARIVIIDGRTVKDDCPGFIENWQGAGLFRLQGPVTKNERSVIEIYGVPPGLSSS